MKTKHYPLLILLPVIAGWIGYYFGAMHEPSVTNLPRGATVAVDQLVSPESFSEVEQARAVLDALATHYVESAQSLIAEENMSRNANPEIRKPNSERPVIAAIKMLDEAIPEFSGTGKEPQLLRPLLFALKKEQLYDRWLDVYLDALYRHPTHDLVSALAEDAAVISQAVGRETELVTGLGHLSDIPLDYLAKARIEQSLVRICANHRVPGENHENRL